MINVRKEVASDPESSSATALAVSIHKTLDQIKAVFSDAFAEGKQKPQGLGFHQLAIFNEIWKQLSRVGKFNDLQSLNQHYIQLEKNLEKTIHFYCYAADFSKEKISASVRNMFLHVIRLYHVFAKQLYQLSLFEVDTSKELEENINEVKKSLQLLRDELAKVNNFEIDNLLSSFELALRELVEKLTSLNYGQIDISFGSDIAASIPNHQVLTDMREQLVRFPTLTQLNQTITNYQDAIEKSMKSDINLSQASLTAWIKLLQDIKSVLNEIISFSLTECTSALQNLSQQCSVTTELLSEVEDRYHSIIENLRIALNIRGHQSVTIEAGKGYQEIREVGAKTSAECKRQQGFTLPFKTNPWSGVDEKLNSLITMQTNEIEKFSVSYLKNVDAIKEIEKEVKEKRYQVRDLDTLLARTDSLITKAKKIPEQCCTVIANVQNTLASHIEMHGDFFKLFFSHHWLKIIIGTLSGSGLAVVGTLTLGLSPAALLVLIPAGALFGFGVGGGAGLASDQLKEKQNKKENNDQQPSQPVAQSGSPIMGEFAKQSLSTRILGIFASRLLPTREGRLDPLIESGNKKRM